LISNLSVTMRFTNLIVAAILGYSSANALYETTQVQDGDVETRLLPKGGFPKGGLLPKLPGKGKLGKGKRAKRLDAVGEDIVEIVERSSGSVLEARQFKKGKKKGKGRRGKGKRGKRGKRLDAEGAEEDEEELVEILQERVGLEADIVEIDEGSSGSVLEERQLLKKGKKKGKGRRGKGKRGKRGKRLDAEGAEEDEEELVEILQERVGLEADVVEIDEGSSGSVLEERQLLKKGKKKGKGKRGKGKRGKRLDAEGAEEDEEELVEILQERATNM